MYRQNKSRLWVKIGKKKFYVEGTRDGRELIFPLLEGGEVERFLPIYLDNKTGEDFYFLREYETHNKFIKYEEINNYHEEAIFGDWQPYQGSGKKLAVVLDRDGLVSYQIRGPKGTGCFSCLQEEKGGTGIFREVLQTFKFKDMLQYKIFIGDRDNTSIEQFAAVLRGIENEDVTTYICSHFGNQKLEELEENGIYLRFPHNGDGYWENYFLKLNDENFRTIEDGSILSKQDKFIRDLDLHERQGGFAIVPFKYDGHFFTLVVDCSTKTINLFDSSLYNVVSDGKESKAFMDFLLENPTVLDENSIESSSFLLNHSDLQGERLEGEPDIKLPEEDPPGCYDMGTCGFWTLAFCIEAANCKDFQELREKCNDDEFFTRIAKRVSAIIDSRDSVKEEDLETYKIPANSVCITSSFKQKTGLPKDEIGQATEYCTEMRQMLITVGPDIKRETGKSSSIVSTEQHKNDNRYILNTTSSFEHSLNQSPIKQPKSKSLPAKETKSPDYWKNKVKKSKSTPSLSRTEHILS